MNNDLISLSALRKEIKLQKSYGGMIQQRDYGTGFVVSLSILEGKLADFPTVDAVSRDEFDALLRRFRHLLQSKFIASFDEYDPKTQTYKRDIAEADKIAPAREGKWETVSLPQDGPRTFCTSCKKIVEVPPFTPYDFCPRCGAKMKLR